MQPSWQVCCSKCVRWGLWRAGSGMVRQRVPSLPKWGIRGIGDSKNAQVCFEMFFKSVQNVPQHVFNGDRLKHVFTIFYILEKRNCVSFESLGELWWFDCRLEQAPSGVYPAQRLQRCLTVKFWGVPIYSTNLKCQTFWAILMMLVSYRDCDCLTFRMLIPRWQRWRWRLR